MAPSLDSVLLLADDYVEIFKYESLIWFNCARTSFNEKCDGLEAWQVSSFTGAGILFVMFLYSILFDYEETLSTRLKKRLFKLARKIPMIRWRIEAELAKTKKDLDGVIRQKGEVFFKSLPTEGFNDSKLIKLVDQYSDMGKIEWQKGRVSGTVYGGDDNMTPLFLKVFEKFAWSNPLHPDVFPGTRKMEAEVVRMVCSMFRGNAQSCGTVTSGGTESLLLVSLACRNRAYQLGIRNPEIVMPVTAHASFDKAAELFRMKIKSIPIDCDTGEVNMNKYQGAISRNTCLLVGSAPGFPHGIIDPIEQISKLGLANNIPVHVDACLGGFLIPFMKKAGFTLPPFDFSLPGVTSISCDTHKYGYATKGTSVIMYRNADLLRCQFFCQPDWPGGIYASPTLAGSRAGSNIALCWAALMHYGQNGYVNRTREVVETTKKIKLGLRKMEGLVVIGDPQVSVVAFKSNKFNIYNLSDMMGKKKWNLNTMQFPSAVHIAVTPHFCLPGVAEQFLEDMRQICAELIISPGSAMEGSAAIYGMAQGIPDRSLVHEFAFAFLDACYDTTDSTEQNGHT